MTSALSHGEPQDDSYCELGFSPNVSLISTVRRFVEEFYEKVLRDAKVTSRLVVATHELLDNAVRYSVDGKSHIRIGVKRGIGNCRVRIETSNRIQPDKREPLAALVAELAGSRDRRAQVYQKLLEETALREVGSGLGLGRIHTETEMDLHCVFDGDVVRMTAEGVFAMGEVNSAGFANIETDDLTTETTFAQGKATVKLAGSAETEAGPLMGAYLSRLHERVVADKVREVVVDIRPLNFMTSSCFKAFVAWLERIRKIPASDRYHLRFVHDERRHWQSRSLEALAAFAVDHIRVEAS